MSTTHAPSAPTAPELAEQRYISLLGDEVRQQMAVLRTLMQPPLSGQPADLNAIADQTRLLDQLLQEISDLSQLMQRDEMFNEGRIDLADMVAQTVSELNQRQKTHCVFTAGQTRPGVLYGNATWMHHAMRALLNTLYASAPPLTHISIALQQMGVFVVLTGKVVNQSVHLPNPEHTPGGMELPPQPAASHPNGSLLLAKRILELHDGKLKLTHPPAPASNVPFIESFKVTLTTGQSEHQRKHLSCAECPMSLQAQVYAQDMATLLTEKPVL